VDTILFLDEANTTPAIGLVKEILCDGRCKGEPIEKRFGLKIIAACNPYRRYSINSVITYLQMYWTYESFHANSTRFLRIFTVHLRFFFEILVWYFKICQMKNHQILALNS